MNFITKQRKKIQTNHLEKQVELLKKEKKQFQQKFQEFQRMVIQLQNINETLQSENRAANCMLSEYEERVEKTMEELAFLQEELEENKSQNQEQVTRLKNQLKQTQQELYVLHLKHQKHHDESSQRMSRLSSSFSSLQEGKMFYMSTNQQQNFDTLNITGTEFKKNKQPAFGKTICLVKNLIAEIDEKAKNARKNKRRISAVS